MQPNLFLKTIAWNLAVVFTWTQVALAAPSGSFFSNKRPDHQTQRQRQLRLLEGKRQLQSGRGGVDTAQSEIAATSLDAFHLAQLTDLTDLYIPENLGRIIDVHDPPDIDPADRHLIIHVQDLHTEPHAQQQLAGLIQHLRRQYDLPVVCAEGAGGRLRTAPLAAFPDVRVRKQLAEGFLQAGELTGEEYLAITSDPSLPIEGVEDADTYWPNLVAFHEVMAEHSASQLLIDQLTAALEVLKPELWNRQLLELDRQHTAYEAGTLAPSDYLGMLRACADQVGLDWEERAPQVARFESLFMQETELDQAAIQPQTQRLMSSLTTAALADRSLQTQLEPVVAAAHAVERRRLASGSFYRRLASAADQLQPHWRTTYPELATYLQYVDASRQLDQVQLYHELGLVYREVQQRLARRSSARELAEHLHRVELLDGLINLRVSNEQFDEYLAHRDDYTVAAFKRFLRPQLRRHGLRQYIDFNAEALDDRLPVLERFYELVKARDASMVANTRRVMDQYDARVTLLVAGGFHTRGITDRLREVGSSYVVVAPSTEGELDYDRYHALLGGATTPLSTMFANVSTSGLRRTQRSSNEMWGDAGEAALSTEEDTASEAVVPVLAGVREGLARYWLELVTGMVLVALVVGGVHAADGLSVEEIAQWAERLLDGDVKIVEQFDRFEVSYDDAHYVVDTSETALEPVPGTELAAVPSPHDLAAVTEVPVAGVPDTLQSATDGDLAHTAVAMAGWGVVDLPWPWSLAALTIMFTPPLVASGLVERFAKDRSWVLKSVLIALVSVAVYFGPDLFVAQGLGLTEVVLDESQLDAVREAGGSVPTSGYQSVAEELSLVNMPHLGVLTNPWLRGLEMASIFLAGALTQAVASARRPGVGRHSLRWLAAGLLGMSGGMAGLLASWFFRNGVVDWLWHEQVGYPFNFFDLAPMQHISGLAMLSQVTVGVALILWALRRGGNSPPPSTTGDASGLDQPTTTTASPPPTTRRLRVWQAALLGTFAVTLLMLSQWSRDAAPPSRSAAQRSEATQVLLDQVDMLFSARLAAEHTEFITLSQFEWLAQGMMPNADMVFSRTMTSRGGSVGQVFLRGKTLAMLSTRERAELLLSLAPPRQALAYLNELRSVQQNRKTITALVDQWTENSHRRRHTIMASDSSVHFLARVYAFLLEQPADGGLTGGESTQGIFGLPARPAPAGAFVNALHQSPEAMLVLAQYYQALAMPLPELLEPALEFDYPQVPIIRVVVGAHSVADREALAELMRTLLRGSVPAEGIDTETLQPMADAVTQRLEALGWHGTPKGRWPGVASLDTQATQYHTPHPVQDMPGKLVLGELQAVIDIRVPDDESLLVIKFKHRDKTTRDIVENLAVSLLLAVESAGVVDVHWEDPRTSPFARALAHAKAGVPPGSVVPRQPANEETSETPISTPTPTPATPDDNDEGRFDGPDSGANSPLGLMPSILPASAVRHAAGNLSPTSLLLSPSQVRLLLSLGFLVFTQMAFLALFFDLSPAWLTDVGDGFTEGTTLAADSPVPDATGQIAQLDVSGDLTAVSEVSFGTPPDLVATDRSMVVGDDLVSTLTMAATPSMGAGGRWDIDAKQQEHAFRILDNYPPFLPLELASAPDATGEQADGERVDEAMSRLKVGRADEVRPYIGAGLVVPSEDGNALVLQPGVVYRDLQDVDGQVRDAQERITPDRLSAIGSHGLVRDGGSAFEGIRVDSPSRDIPRLIEAGVVVPGQKVGSLRIRAGVEESTIRRVITLREAANQPRRVNTDKLLQQAVARMDVRDWPGAEDLLRRAQNVTPKGYGGVAVVRGLLETARQADRVARFRTHFESRLVEEWQGGPMAMVGGEPSARPRPRRQELRPRATLAEQVQHHERDAQWLRAGRQAVRDAQTPDGLSKVEANAVREAAEAEWSVELQVVQQRWHVAVEALRREVQQSRTLRSNIARDVDPMARTLNVFDVDSRPAALVEAMWLVDSGEVGEVVIHGNLFGMGNEHPSDSREVLRLLGELQERLGDRLIMLFGHRDVLMIRGLLLDDGHALIDWLSAGLGGPALAQFGVQRNYVQEVDQLRQQQAEPWRYDTLAREIWADTQVQSVRQVARWMLTHQYFHYVDWRGMTHAHAGIPLYRGRPAMTRDEAVQAQDELFDIQAQLRALSPDVVGLDEGIQRRATGLFQRIQGFFNPDQGVSMESLFLSGGGVVTLTNPSDQEKAKREMVPYHAQMEDNADALPWNHPLILDALGIEFNITPHRANPEALEAVLSSWQTQGVMTGHWELPASADVVAINQRLFRGHQGGRALIIQDAQGIHLRQLDQQDDEVRREDTTLLTRQDMLAQLTQEINAKSELAQLTVEEALPPEVHEAMEAPTDGPAVSAPNRIMPEQRVSPLRVVVRQIMNRHFLAGAMTMGVAALAMLTDFDLSDIDLTAAEVRVLDATGDLTPSMVSATVAEVGVSLGVDGVGVTEMGMAASVTPAAVRQPPRETSHEAEQTDDGQRHNRPMLIQLLERGHEVGMMHPLRDHQQPLLRDLERLLVRHRSGHSSAHPHLLHAVRVLRQRNIAITVVNDFWWPTGGYYGEFEPVAVDTITNTIYIPRSLHEQLNNPMVLAVLVARALRHIDSGASDERWRFGLPWYFAPPASHADRVATGPEYADYSDTLDQQVEEVRRYWQGFRSFEVDAVNGASPQPDPPEGTPEDTGSTVVVRLKAETPLTRVVRSRPQIAETALAMPKPRRDGPDRVTNAGTGVDRLRRGASYPIEYEPVYRDPWVYLSQIEAGARAVAAAATQHDRLVVFFSLVWPPFLVSLADEVGARDATIAATIRDEVRQALSRIGDARESGAFVWEDFKDFERLMGRIIRHGHHLDSRLPGRGWATALLIRKIAKQLRHHPYLNLHNVFVVVDVLDRRRGDQPVELLSSIVYEIDRFDPQQITVFTPERPEGRIEERQILWLGDRIDDLDPAFHALGFVYRGDRDGVVVTEAIWAELSQLVLPILHNHPYHREPNSLDRVIRQLIQADLTTDTGQPLPDEEVLLRYGEATAGHETDHLEMLANGNPTSETLETSAYSSHRMVHGLPRASLLTVAQLVLLHSPYSDPRGIYLRAGQRNLAALAHVMLGLDVTPEQFTADTPEGIALIEQVLTAGLPAAVDVPTLLDHWAAAHVSALLSPEQVETRVKPPQTHTPPDAIEPGDVDGTAPGNTSGTTHEKGQRKVTSTVRLAWDPAATLRAWRDALTEQFNAWLQGLRTELQHAFQDLRDLRAEWLDDLQSAAQRVVQTVHAVQSAVRWLGGTVSRVTISPMLRVVVVGLLFGWAWLWMLPHTATLPHAPTVAPPVVTAQPAQPPAATPQADRVLRRGAQGPQVTAYAERLEAVFDVQQTPTILAEAKLPIDGAHFPSAYALERARAEFGWATEAVTLAFQVAEKLQVDGQAGPQTRGHIDAITRGEASPAVPPHRSIPDTPEPPHQGDIDPADDLQPQDAALAPTQLGDTSDTAVATTAQSALSVADRHHVRVGTQRTPIPRMALVALVLVLLLLAAPAIAAPVVDQAQEVLAFLPELDPALGETPVTVQAATADAVSISWAEGHEAVVTLDGTITVNGQPASLVGGSLADPTPLVMDEAGPVVTDTVEPLAVAMTSGYGRGRRGGGAEQIGDLAERYLVLATVQDIYKLEEAVQYRVGRGDQGDVGYHLRQIYPDIYRFREMLDRAKTQAPWAPQLVTADDEISVAAVDTLEATTIPADSTTVTELRQHVINTLSQRWPFQDIWRSVDELFIEFYVEQYRVAQRLWQLRKAPMASVDALIARQGVPTVPRRTDAGSSRKPAYVEFYQYAALERLLKQFPLETHGVRDRVERFLRVILNGFVSAGAGEHDTENPRAIYSDTGTMQFGRYGPLHILFKTPLPSMASHVMELGLPDEYHLMYVAPANVLDFIRNTLRAIVADEVTSQEVVSRKQPFTIQDVDRMSAKLITHQRLVEVLEALEATLQAQTTHELTQPAFSELASTLDIPQPFLFELLKHRDVSVQNIPFAFMLENERGLNAAADHVSTPPATAGGTPDALLVVLPLLIGAGLLGAVLWLSGTADPELVTTLLGGTGESTGSGVTELAPTAVAMAAGVGGDRDRGDDETPRSQSAAEAWARLVEEPGSWSGLPGRLVPQGPLTGHLWDVLKRMEEGLVPANVPIDESLFGGKMHNTGALGMGEPADGKVPDSGETPVSKPPSTVSPPADQVSYARNPIVEHADPVGGVQTVHSDRQPDDDSPEAAAAQAAQFVKDRSGSDDGKLAQVLRPSMSTSDPTFMGYHLWSPEARTNPPYESRGAAAGPVIRTSESEPDMDPAMGRDHRATGDGSPDQAQTESIDDAESSDGDPSKPTPYRRVRGEDDFPTGPTAAEWHAFSPEEQRRRLVEVLMMLRARQLAGITGGGLLSEITVDMRTVSLEALVEALADNAIEVSSAADSDTTAEEEPGKNEAQEPYDYVLSTQGITGSSLTTTAAQNPPSTEEAGAATESTADRQQGQAQPPDPYPLLPGPAPSLSLQVHGPASRHRPLTATADGTERLRSALAPGASHQLPTDHGADQTYDNKSPYAGDADPERAAYSRPRSFGVGEDPTGASFQRPVSRELARALADLNEEVGQVWRETPGVRDELVRFNTFLQRYPELYQWWSELRRSPEYPYLLFSLLLAGVLTWVEVDPDQQTELVALARELELPPDQLEIVVPELGTTTAVVEPTDTRVLSDITSTAATGTGAMMVSRPLVDAMWQENVRRAQDDDKPFLQTPTTREEAYKVFFAVAEGMLLQPPSMLTIGQIQELNDAQALVSPDPKAPAKIADISPQARLATSIVALMRHVIEGQEVDKYPLAHLHGQLQRVSQQHLYLRELKSAVDTFVHEARWIEASPLVAQADRLARRSTGSQVVDRPKLSAAMARWGVDDVGQSSVVHHQTINDRDRAFQVFFEHVADLLKQHPATLTVAQIQELDTAQDQLQLAMPAGEVGVIFSPRWTLVKGIVSLLQHLADGHPIAEYKTDRLQRFLQGQRQRHSHVLGLLGDTLETFVARATWTENQAIELERVTLEGATNILVAQAQAFQAGEPEHDDTALLVAAVQWERALAQSTDVPQETRTRVEDALDQQGRIHATAWARREGFFRLAGWLAQDVLAAVGVHEAVPQSVVTPTRQRAMTKELDRLGGGTGGLLGGMGPGVGRPPVPEREVEVTWALPLGRVEIELPDSAYRFSEVPVVWVDHHPVFPSNTNATQQQHFEHVVAEAEARALEAAAQRYQPTTSDAASLVVQVHESGLADPGAATRLVLDAQFFTDGTGPSAQWIQQRLDRGVQLYVHVDEEDATQRQAVVDQLGGGVVAFVTGAQLDAWRDSTAVRLIELRASMVEPGYQADWLALAEDLATGGSLTLHTVPLAGILHDLPRRLQDRLGAA